MSEACHKHMFLQEATNEMHSFRSFQVSFKVFRCLSMSLLLWRMTTTWKIAYKESDLINTLDLMYIYINDLM